MIVGRRALIAWTKFSSLSTSLVSFPRRSSYFTHFNLSYVGTSIEARYIAIDLIGPWTTNTNVTYSIDGGAANMTQRASTNITDYLYDQLLFRIDGLPNVEHTLRVDIQQPGVLLVSLVCNRAEGTEVYPFCSARLLELHRGGCRRTNDHKLRPTFVSTFA